MGAARFRRFNLIWPQHAQNFLFGSRPRLAVAINKEEQQSPNFVVGVLIDQRAEVLFYCQGLQILQSLPSKEGGRVQGDGQGYADGPTGLR
jgi:hypothetical protein